ncbi:MAG: CocE/NonD family hydrolase [Gemmatimonadota bacterium]
MERIRPAIQSAILGVLLAGPLAGQARPLFGVMIPMRDGVKLATDVWLPEAPGRYPIILIRTPYGRVTDMLNVPQWAEYYAARGYGFAIQDVRGRGDSDGEFNFFFQEGHDGFDSIEWLATQPWSNGRIGMMGVSYLGTVQWLAAKEHPSHLVCMAPTAPAGRYLDELPFLGGALMHQWALTWLNGTSGRVQQGDNARGVIWDRVLAHRPLLTADSVMGRPMRLYREFLTHPLMDDYWKRIQFTAGDFKKIDIPTLTVTGWFDGDQPGAMFYWRGLQQNAPSKEKHFLVGGPWEHAPTFLGGTLRVGDMEFTPESVVDVKALHLAFFDWCLKGTAPKFDAPKSRVYVTGANEWRSYDSYPPATSSDRQLYLTSGGKANSVEGDGKLGWRPAANDPPDHYSYDPKHPVPSEIGGEMYANDRRPVQRRDDVLVYTTEALTESLDVIGNVVVNLQAASDALDTDFTAVLTDVYPDGRAIKLGPEIGIRRARYRNGYTKEELLTPRTVANFRIELYDIAHQFKPDTGSGSRSRAVRHLCTTRIKIRAIRSRRTWNGKWRTRRSIMTGRGRHRLRYRWSESRSYHKGEQRCPV